MNDKNHTSGIQVSFLTRSRFSFFFTRRGGGGLCPIQVLPDGCVKPCLGSRGKGLFREKRWEGVAEGVPSPYDPTPARPGLEEVVP